MDREESWVARVGDVIVGCATNVGVAVCEERETFERGAVSVGGWVPMKPVGVGGIVRWVGG